MNYRHAFHAGNFADVHKHAVLARVVAHLKEKPAPFRVIDTHAGPGLTDLTGPEATRTGEWRAGIERLLAAPLPQSVRALLEPYLDAVAAFNPHGRLVAYPGSPLLARTWLRPHDRLVACELEAGAAAALARRLKGAAHAKSIAIDGWTALSAYLPPMERRGVVLIDPPFEAPEDFSHLVAALETARRKWPTGIYLLWYPIKDRRQTQTLLARVAGLAIPKILRTELLIAAPGLPKNLIGSGLLVLNPPWTLETELQMLLPALLSAMRQDPSARFELDWISHEK